MLTLSQLVRDNYDFAAVTIPNQTQITAQTGAPLDLPAAVKLLRIASREFADTAAPNLAASIEHVETLVARYEAGKAKTPEPDSAQVRAQMLEAIETMQMLLDDVDADTRAQMKDAIETMKMLLED